MTIFHFSALLLVIFMSLIFMLALWLKDNSIVDIAYGLAFVLIAWIGIYLYGSNHPRQILLGVLITLWGGRLAAYIGLRKRTEEGEDSRYRQWRESWGKNFVWRSFLQIYMLQGTVIYLVSLPLLLVVYAPGAALGWTDLAGGLIWLTGLTFETISDYQLLNFKRNPENRGRMYHAGLRRYSRHPNYFGEALLWWGIFLIAVNSPLGLAAIISPLLIAFLLLQVSGIPMLEAKYAGRPEFEAYKNRTNAFFPWFPREGSRKL